MKKEKLIIKYEKELKYFAYSLTNNKQDAEDLLQDTYVKLWKNIDGFKDTGKEDSFKWWAFTAMKNVHIDGGRKGKSNKRFHLSANIVHDEETGENLTLQNIPANSHFNADTLLFDKEVEHTLHCAKSKLKNNVQKVFEIMRDGYSYEEMAEILNLPINTVKIHIHRVRKSLMENKDIKEYVMA